MHPCTGHLVCQHIVTYTLPFTPCLAHILPNKAQTADRTDNDREEEGLG
jgi:hypothetical protein